MIADFAASPACPPACTVLRRHVTTCPTAPVDLGRARCPTDGTLQPVVDRFTASEMTTRGEQEYTVTALACGHQITGTPRTVAPAPGAPYAGADRVVAASTRPRDLRAASCAQRVLDGRNGEQA